MERIRSAIDKARATRQGKGEAEASPPHAAATSVAAAWAALKEVPVESRKLEAARIIAHQPGPGVTSYDLLRAKLLKHLRAQDWARVAITSPSSGCGKTTLCLNLAFSLARQSELRILVLEMDWRRPSIVRLLGLPDTVGLADVLSGRQSPEDSLVRIGPNLAFGVNRTPVQNPAELLSSAQAAAMIDSIQAHFKPDVILFDLPPVLLTDDTIAFVGQVDCALIVAAAEQSTVDEIDLAGKELALSTQVLGVVLNKCRYPDRVGGNGYDEY